MIFFIGGAADIATGVIALCLIALSVAVAVTLFLLCAAVAAAVAFLLSGAVINFRLGRPFYQIPGTLQEEYLRVKEKVRMRKIESQEENRERLKRLLLKMGIKSAAMRGKRQQNDDMAEFVNRLNGNS
ncbi:MAG: hypothetical protein ACLQF0_04365 [Dissulfurispiraceae bacterium]